MPTRKRIKVIIPQVGGGGGGGPTPGGTINWGPSFGQSAGDDDSTWNANAAVDLDRVGLIGNTTTEGAITLTDLGITGDVSSGCSIDLDSLALDGGVSVDGAVSAQLKAFGVEAFEDTYLDQGSGSTAFGGATALLSKTSAALGSDEQIAYLAWDFTWLDGTVDAATIDVTVSTSTALGENANFSVQTNPTKPFEEDTATWDSDETPAGTQRQTIAQAVTTTPTTYTLTLNATARANMPGNWVMLRLPGTALLGLGTITTVSKESATASERPQMDYEVTLA